MCTVSAYHTGESLIITSNRDEKLSRPLASAPEVEYEGDRGFYFARDPKAGGTWFVCDNRGQAAVLLNGAFVRHESRAPYRESRGVVLMNLFRGELPLREVFEGYELEGVEPFQVLSYSIGGGLERFLWDGSERHCVVLDMMQPCIFSSATLYEPEAVIEREKWFSAFLGNTQKPTAEAIFKFHSSEDESDRHNSLLMYRPGSHRTYSVSQVEIKPAESIYRHIDLQKPENNRYRRIAHQDRCYTM